MKLGHPNKLTIACSRAKMDVQEQLRRSYKKSQSATVDTCTQASDSLFVHVGSKQEVKTEPPLKKKTKKTTCIIAKIVFFSFQGDRQRFNSVGKENKQSATVCASHHKSSRCHFWTGSVRLLCKGSIWRVTGRKVNFIRSKAWQFCTRTVTNK